MNNELTNEKIKNIILDFENKYPVNSWKVDNIEIWPYVRNKLYIFLLNYGVDKKEAIVNRIPQSKELNTSLFNKGIRFIFSYFELLNFYGNLNEKDILFLSVPIHRINYKGRAFNRYFDPIIEKYNLIDEVYVMENQHTTKDVFHSEAVIPLKKFIDIFRLKERFKSKVKNQSSAVSEDIFLMDYESFHKEVNQLFPGTDEIGISKQHLLSWAAKIKSTSRFFVKIFKKINPSKVIVQSFNSFDDFYAALYSANKLSIRTIDFQHGFQTDYHMIYSNWSKFPEKGYNILPREYWHWDENSSKNVKSWAGSNTEIKSIVVGHPYLSYWVEKKNRKVQSSDKLVFYSLGIQQMDVLFPERLLDVIRKTQMHWVIRLHPRSNIRLNDIHELFQKERIALSKITIQDPFESPLPEALANSYVHLTHFSGCVIEAKMMGIPTIIISEAGKEYFRKYIDNFSVYFQSINEPQFDTKLSKIFSEILKRKLPSTVGKIINPLEI